MLTANIQVILLVVALQTYGQPIVRVELAPGTDKCPRDVGGGIVRGTTYGEGDGGHRPVPPLEVILVSMNREEYRVGDPLVFEVSVKNRSGKNQRIPTLPRGSVCDELDPSKAEEADAKIQLRLKTSSGKSQLVSVATLWTSPKRKDSWAVLEPGQTALFIVSKEWKLPYFPEGTPDRAEAFVAVERPGTMTVESSNGIPVRMAP